jgi:hypothetical protein
MEAVCDVPDLHEKEVAEKVLSKLRDDLHVYTGDIKVVTKRPRVIR